MADDQKNRDTASDQETDLSIGAFVPSKDISAAGAPSGAPAIPVLAPEMLEAIKEQEVAPSQQPAQQSDMAQVLASIKLPERREFRASGDVQVPQQGPAAPIAPATPEPAPQATERPAAILDTGHASASVTAVRTLKDDLQDVVRERKISLTNAIALEQRKRAGQERVAPEEEAIKQAQRKRTTLLIFVAVLLFMLGGAALFGVYYVMMQKNGLPRQEQGSAIASSSILFAESAVSFALDNQDSASLKEQLAQARNSSLGSLGSIVRIVPTVSDTSGTARPATLAEFFSALGIKAPDELLRAAGTDFFFGLHIVDKNAPVLIIPITSYDHAFAGMLAWESSMNTDLAPVFTAIPMMKAGAGGVPVARTFQDVVMRNFDTRALEDDNGQIMLYYSFPNPNMLVIAESPYSFAEILTRLQASRKL